MKSYVGTKIIKAKPMEQLEAAQLSRQDVGSIKIDGKGHSAAGYLVIYPDGYMSWSPKKTFESAYREISEDEKKLIREAAHAG